MAGEWIEVLIADKVTSRHAWLFAFGCGICLIWAGLLIWDIADNRSIWGAVHATGLVWTVWVTSYNLRRMLNGKGRKAASSDQSHTAGGASAGNGTGQGATAIFTCLTCGQTNSSGACPNPRCGPHQTCSHCGTVIQFGGGCACGMMSYARDRQALLAQLANQNLSQVHSQAGALANQLGAFMRGPISISYPCQACGYRCVAAQSSRGAKAGLCSNCFMSHYAMQNGFLVPRDVVQPPAKLERTVKTGEIVAHRLWRLKAGLLTSIASKEVWLLGEVVKAHKAIPDSDEGIGEHVGVHGWRDKQDMVRYMMELAHGVPRYQFQHESDMVAFDTGWFALGTIKSQPSCSTCRFFAGQKPTPDLPAPIIGLCRYNAPSPVVPSAGHQATAWPSVAKTDWCGRWQEDGAA